MNSIHGILKHHGVQGELLLQVMLFDDQHHCDESVGIWDLLGVEMP